MKRRSFIQGAGTALASSVFASQSPTATKPNHPVAVASGNGLKSVELAVKQMLAGGDPLDAAVAGVNLVEEDPEDTSVGYGGLPNERGVVELDSCVMHGPTHNGGAVASLRNIKYPSRVARLVMKRTDHVLLVGQGALEFARAHGIPEENLLTEKARKIWLAWKESLSKGDDWLPPEDLTAQEPWLKKWYERFAKRHTGTINCCCVDKNGDIGGVTTTSGLAFKIPGRVGDSPILGAGLFLDNGYGACGSTGRGEANLLNLSSFLAVEEMRRGASPREAGLAACKRIVEHNRDPRLQKADGSPDFNVKFFLVNKAGDYAGCAIRDRGAKYAVCDENGPRLEELTVLYD
ncbi:MAG: N(4)-(beta-N-acetylglucosaminyl)-L-asparaginase [Acidobacteriota bacterium]|nr:N(4)-(beta-N-acetylglucosaminyl)-L-asparaginase [Acidobacteriota bacterium]